MKKIDFAQIHILCASLVNSLLVTQVRAQETLPELVVTGNRSSQTIDDLPYTSDLLSADDLLNNATPTLPDAFIAIPGILIQKTTTGHGSPYIRGFTGRQNLLLQDGIRLNNSTWREGPVQYWNTLDPFALNQIELIKSQGSVLYGSDAIGGTVNTLSQETGFRDEDGVFSRGSSFYRFDTNSGSHVGRIEQAIGEANRWGLLLGYSKKNFGDIRDSALGRMKNTGYQEENFDLKFEYALSESRTLTFFHSSLDQDNITRWHSTIDNPGWIHGSYFTTPGSDLQRLYDQERSLTYLRIEDTESNLSWIERWQTTISFQKTQDSEDRIRSSGRQDLKILDVQTVGLNVVAESGQLVWGLDYYHDEVSSEGYRDGNLRASNRPVADDAHYDSAGIFANYTIQSSENLRYDLGARISYMEAGWRGYRPEGALEDQTGGNSWEDLSLSARTLYELDQTWSLFGGLSQAFRAPNLDDLTGQQFSLNGLNSNGSPNVDSENYLTAEIGSQHQWDELSLNISNYYTWIENGITRVEDGAGGLITKNGNQGAIYGTEAALTWEFHPQWKLSAHAAWQDGHQTIDGVKDTIRRMHPLMGATSVTWTHPSEKLWISSRVTAARHQNNLSRLAASDTQRIPIHGTPGYLVASIFAGWQVRENFQVGLGLENLFDEDYRVHGSGQNATGFNSTLSVKIDW